jgi:hypothetical protein
MVHTVNSVKKLMFAMVKCRFLFEVRTEILNGICMSFGLKLPMLTSKFRPQWPPPYKNKNFNFLGHHRLRESPLPASSIVSLSIVFLVYLCLFSRMVDIYMPVVERGYVPFFADVLSIYS